MSLQEDARIILEEYAAKCALEPALYARTLDDALHLARMLRSYGRQLDELQTAECNRPLTASEQTRLESIPHRAQMEAAQWGLKLYHNGDPRGRSLGVLCPLTKRYNTMGGVEAGWRVGE